MTIICDIDGILNDLVEKTLCMYNSNSGKSIQVSDITSYNFFDCLSYEDAEEIVALFKNKSLWDSLKPREGSQNALKQLVKNGHNVYLATATDPVNFSWKIDWLQQYFPFITSDNVIRIMDKSLLKCDILIDDCLDNLIGVLCDRVTLNCPWNQSVSKDIAYDIIRCNNWNEIVMAINKLVEEE